MLRNDSNYMSNDSHQLLEMNNKLNEEPNHKISADYSELMKKVGERFHGMPESTAEYYKQKEEEIDKMEKNIQLGNKLSVINEKILIDKYLSLTPTL
jgi:hypothetical protein